MQTSPYLFRCNLQVRLEQHKAILNKYIIYFMFQARFLKR